MQKLLLVIVKPVGVFFFSQNIVNSYRVSYKQYQLDIMIGVYFNKKKKQLKIIWSYHLIEQLYCYNHTCT